MIHPTRPRDLADHYHDGLQWRPLDHHLPDGTPLAGYTENESGRREVRRGDGPLDTTRGTKAVTTVDTNAARRGVCTLTARLAQEPWLTITLRMATMACRALSMLHTDTCRPEAMVATHPQWRRARQQAIPTRTTTHDRHWYRLDTTPLAIQVSQIRLHNMQYSLIRSRQCPARARATLLVLPSHLSHTWYHHQALNDTPPRWTCMAGDPDPRALQGPRHMDLLIKQSCPTKHLDLRRMACHMACQAIPCTHLCMATQHHRQRLHHRPKSLRRTKISKC